MSQYYLRSTIAKKNTSLNGNDSLDFITVFRHINMSLPKGCMVSLYQPACIFGRILFCIVHLLWHSFMKYLRYGTLVGIC